jgi:hypothetical protein
MNKESWLKRKCPFCAKEISADAKSCNYCGKWITGQQENLEPQQLAVGRQFSNAQPVWHLVILSIATFGFYGMYWFYRNWKQFKLHKRLDISPGWRTAGLFVPIYGIVLAYRQIRDIKEFSEEVGIDKTYSPGWVVFGWVIFSGFGNLPGTLWLLCSLSVLPLIVVQGVLNFYWRKEQPELMERTTLSGGQIALLIIGGIWWLFSLIGTFTPENNIQL